MKERKQLEPFEQLKDMIVRSFEQQGIREAIAEMRVNEIVERSNGNITQEQVMDERADSLSAVDAEMKYLIQEYHDGLLLYEISNREVWDRAAKDEEGLRAWFKTHKKDYAWQEPRYKGIAYHVKTKADVKAVKKCVKNLPFDQWAEALRTTFNPDSVIRIRVEKGLFKPGDNGTIDRMVFRLANPKAEEALPDYPIDAVYGKKLKKYPEDYIDVRSQVVNDYQQMLEQEWIKSLRSRYSVQINHDILKTVNQHK
jgi:peptidyl-prolyl cis-trans isomerase SurA